MEKATATTSRANIPLSKKIWAHIELADPVTWMSPSLICICGAIASGRSEGFNATQPRDVALVALGALMTGPLGTGFSQSINDYFDRHLDAINDPARPIPSGRVTLAEARINWIVLAVATMLVSLLFSNPWMPALAALGLVLSVIYSQEPIKLKKRFWLGPPAVGLGYVSMSWIAGHLIFAPITWPSIIVAVINGGIATGMLFLNDIKSVEGDRQHGLKSLTVALGVHKSLIVAYATINFFQILLMVLAIIWGHYYIAGILFLAVVLPIYNQVKLYQEPNHKNFMRYLIASNPFIVVIQFVSAFLVGGYFG